MFEVLQTIVAAVAVPSQVKNCFALASCADNHNDTKQSTPTHERLCFGKWGKSTNTKCYQFRSIGEATNSDLLVNSFYRCQREEL